MILTFILFVVGIIITYLYNRSKRLEVNLNDIKELYAQSIQLVDLNNQISLEQFKKDLIAQLVKAEVKKVTFEIYQDAIFMLLRNKYNRAIELDIHWDPEDLFGFIKKLEPKFEFNIIEAKIERYQENFFLKASVMGQKVEGEFETLYALIKKINVILDKHFHRQLYRTDEPDDSYRFILVPTKNISKLN